MERRYRSGETLAQIGEAYGLSRERVRQILHKYRGFTAGDGGASLRCLPKTHDIRAARDKRSADLFARWGLTLDEYKAHTAEFGRCGDRQSALAKFIMQRKNARQRGIGWNFTFKDWFAVWQESGHWEQRGRGKGYCMTRIGDSGPYERGNVAIKTIGENFSESYLVHPWHERFAHANFGWSGKRTHCKNGHALIAENIYICAAGRICRACDKRRRKEYRARRDARTQQQPETIAA